MAGLRQNLSVKSKTAVEATIATRLPREYRVLRLSNSADMIQILFTQSQTGLPKSRDHESVKEIRQSNEASPCKPKVIPKNFMSY